MKEPRTSWLTPAAPSTAMASRPLASSLRPAGAPSGTSWLAATPASADAGPAVCARCGELDAIKADLAEVTAAAAARGREEGLAETAKLRERLQAAVTALSSVRTEREAALTETIVDVALGLCEWLAPAAAAIDRRGLAALVNQALAAGGGRDLVLRLNGDDAAELGSHIPAGVTCEVVDNLAPGEVWVEAPRLVVDARWPTRLAALREPLLALLKTEASAHELSIDDDRPTSSTMSGRRIAAPPAPGGAGVSQRMKPLRGGS